jgi:uncharacterized protein (TIRG00374 family)
MKRFLFQAGRLLFSLFLVWFLFSRIDTEQFFRLWGSLLPGYVTAAFITLALTVVLGIIRWKILLLRYTSEIPTPELVKLNCAGYFYNVFFPGGFAGDLVRGVKLTSGVLSKVQSLAVVFMDRLFGLFGFMVLGLVSLLISLFYPVNNYILVGMIVIFLLVAAFILFIVRGREKKETGRKMILKLYEFMEYLREYRGKNTILWKALWVSTATAVVNVFVFVLLGKAMDLSLSPEVYFLVIPYIIILSMFPVTFKGLGIREALFILLLKPFGIVESQALSLSLLYFGCVLSLALVTGLVYFVMDLGK